MTQSNLLYHKDQTDKEKFLRSIGWIVLSVVVVYSIIFLVMPICSRYCAGPSPPECMIGSMIGLLFMLIFIMSVIQIITMVFRATIKMVRNNDDR